MLPLPIVPHVAELGELAAGFHDHRMDKIWWSGQWMGELGPHDSAPSNVDNAATLEGKLLLVVEPRAQGLAFDEGHHAVAVRERGGESIGGRVQRPDPKRGLGTLRRLSILGPPSGCCILWLGFDELVERFNQVEAQYRSDLRELNELNFARFDAKVEQLALIAGLYLR